MDFWRRLTGRPPTLAEGLASHRDNFLLLRLIAAALVIYGHSKALTGGPCFRDLFVTLGFERYSGTLAVEIFFLVSGYMITGSYIRRPEPLRYLQARFFRIVPAYAVCLVVCAFVVGAAYTSLPLGDYYAHPATRDYVLHNLKFGIDLRWDLPGVFTDNPKRTTVNGSLWTLPIEVRMYACVFVLGIVGLLARRFVANLVFLGMVVATIVAMALVPGFGGKPWYHLAAMFALGGACYVNRTSLPASGRVTLLLVAAAWATHHTAAFEAVYALALASFVFWFGYRLPLHGYNRFGDYSYGTYLWAFPVQQAIAHHLPMLSGLQHTALALPISIGLGVASWKLVEKPALTLGHSLHAWRRGLSTNPAL